MIPGTNEIQTLNMTYMAISILRIVYKWHKQSHVRLYLYPVFLNIQVSLKYMSLSYIIINLLRYI